MRVLYDHFHALQKSAGVRDQLGEFYGFHDFRRAFATENVGNVAGDVLQALMQHRSYATTQKYINLSQKLKPSAVSIFTPDLSRKTDRARAT
jgi:integrase